MSLKRVVITGMGMVSPLGSNVSVSWRRLLEGKSGIRSLESEIYSDKLPNGCKLGASVCKEFDGKNYRTLGTDNLLSQMTMSAAIEAVEDSGIKFDREGLTKLNYKTVSNIVIIFLYV